MRRLYVPIGLAFASLAAAGQLTDFRPSPIESPHGAVSVVEFSTPLVVLEPGALAHHLDQMMANYRFAEPVWVIGYKTEILDAQGKPPRENYLCHTFFGDQHVTQRQELDMRAVYSDSFTPEMRLPQGFGVRLTPDDNLHWMPMFNNRDDRPVRVRMKVEITLIREKDLKKPLQPLYSTLQSVVIPHLFFVPPGHHERQATFQLPFDAKIHFLGTHIHPHGSSIELFNVSRGERVWKGLRKTDNAGRMVGMDVYSSVEGYTVRAGETFRVTSVYNNPTRDQIDAMAGVFVFYSRR
ncbi:MAG: hypothetical protein HY238_19575 [Acidobacteria bacterium]|nr:hypothetical protein [Acidobacteriota bacterium]